MEGVGNNREILDLLRKVTKTQSECPQKNKKQEEEEEEEGEEDEDEDMELSLGLSMNGRFGVDPTRTKKLKRSSSIANSASAGETGISPGARGAVFEADATLSRTRSLPVETEEVWRRRKELQSMRRMEARKKRMQKLKNLRVPRDANGGKNGPYEVANGDSDGRRFGKRILRWFENGEVIESFPQGSIGPLRSGSSGSSDLTEGWKQNTEVSPSSRIQSSNGLEPSCRASERETKAPISQQLKNTMHDMPYVTTKETGPNGRKVEGFLYGYKRGEDVRIMCICHGSFLSPKEFVEHGGVRGKVEHPLKHIVVSPFPLL